MALTDTTHIERSQLRQNQNLEITKKATKFLGAEIGIQRLQQNPKFLGEQTTQIPKL